MSLRRPAASFLAWFAVAVPCAAGGLRTSRAEEPGTGVGGADAANVGIGEEAVDVGSAAVSPAGDLCPAGFSFGVPGRARCADPRSRAGTVLFWTHDTVERARDDRELDRVSWRLEGEWAFAERWSASIDFESLRHDTELGTGVGALAVRILANVLWHPSASLALDVGLLLPAADRGEWTAGRSIGIDPAILLSLRPIPEAGVSLSLPFTAEWVLGGSAGVVVSFFRPTISTIVMPVPWIGAFADVQLDVLIAPDARHAFEALGGTHLAVGVRARPIDWLVAELGVLVALTSGLYDAGLAFRLAYAYDPEE